MRVISVLLSRVRRRELSCASGLRGPLRAFLLLLAPLSPAPSSGAPRSAWSRRPGSWRRGGPSTVSSKARTASATPAAAFAASRSPAAPSSASATLLSAAATLFRSPPMALVVVGVLLPELRQLLRSLLEILLELEDLGILAYARSALPRSRVDPLRAGLCSAGRCRRTEPRMRNVRSVWSSAEMASAGAGRRPRRRGGGEAADKMRRLAGL